MGLSLGFILLFFCMTLGALLCVNIADKTPGKWSHCSRCLWYSFPLVSLSLSECTNPARCNIGAFFEMSISTAVVRVIVEASGALEKPREAR